MGASISLFRRRRRSAQVPPPAPPPEPQSLSSLPENALAEIFLRLPPHPGFLREVSLSSHQFQDVVTNGPFLRRFHAHHGDLPPLVGFLWNERPRFVRLPPQQEPTGSGSDTAAAAGAGPLAAWDDNWPILCTRHGRIVLQSPDLRYLLVLDPMAAGPDRRQYIVAPGEYRRRTLSTAALVCDPEPAGHGGCRASPFRIVFIFYNTGCNIQPSISIYSSETNRWVPVRVAVDQTTIDISRPAVQVGDVLYWLSIFHSIVSCFHVNTHELREITLPVYIPRNEELAGMNTQVLAPKDSSLGFVFIGWFNLEFWGSNFIDGHHVEWTPRSVVRLDSILTQLPTPWAPPMSTADHPPARLIGYDDDENVVYLRTDFGIFALQLDRMRSKQLPVDYRWWSHRVDYIYPYKSFYISQAVLRD